MNKVFSTILMYHCIYTGLRCVMWIVINCLKLFIKCLSIWLLNFMVYNPSGSNQIASCAVHSVRQSNTFLHSPCYELTRDTYFSKKNRNQDKWGKVFCYNQQIFETVVSFLFVKTIIFSEVHAERWASALDVIKTTIVEIRSSKKPNVTKRPSDRISPKSNSSVRWVTLQQPHCSRPLTVA
jgi:hypothetical protein